MANPFGLDPPAVIALGWSAFAGTHLVMSHPPIREALMRSLGKGGFMGIYNVTSLAIFVPLVWYYNKHGDAGPQLFEPVGAGAPRALATALLVEGASFLSQLPSSPSESGQMMEVTMGGKKVEQLKPPRGVVRITRHPLNMGLALFGIGKALLSGKAGPVAFWLGFAVFGVVGSLHQDFRHASVLPAKYFAETSFLPFMAILRGKQSLGTALSEFNWPAAIIMGALAVPGVAHKVWTTVTKPFA